MPKKKDRLEIKKEISDFFNSDNFNKKNPNDIKKIKKKAMGVNLKLGEMRKKFCQKCYSNKLKVKSIKRGLKIVECENCGKIAKWKIKTF